MITIWHVVFFVVVVVFSLLSFITLHINVLCAYSKPCARNFTMYIFLSCESAGMLQIWEKTVFLTNIKTEEHGISCLYLLFLRWEWKRGKNCHQVHLYAGLHCKRTTGMLVCSVWHFHLVRYCRRTSCHTIPIHG